MPTNKNPPKKQKTKKKKNQTKKKNKKTHKKHKNTTENNQKKTNKNAKAYGIGLARLSDSAKPGDLHAITNSLARRMPPMSRIDGEVLSGALYVDVMGIEGWKWFPCGKALLNELYLVDCLTAKKSAPTQS